MATLPVLYADPELLTQRLAEIREYLTVTDDPTKAKSVVDQMAGLKAWAESVHLGQDAQNAIAEVKLRAERRCGQLIPRLLARPGKARQGRRPKGTAEVAAPPSLADLGVSRLQSHWWQTIAYIPEDVFDASLQNARAKRRELTTTGMVALGRKFRPPAVLDPDAAEQQQLPDPPPLPHLSNLYRLEQGDAVDLPLDEACVDLIVTSPPYGLGKDYGDDYDDSPAGWAQFTAEWLLEAYRVAAPGCRLALNIPLDTADHRNPYSDALLAAEHAGWRYRFTIVWNEGNITHSTGRGSVDSPQAVHVIAPVEMVLVMYKGEWKREKPGVAPDLTHDEWLAWTNGLWTFPGERNAHGGHPAAFPLELPRRLIKLLSFPGDRVLDPFVGSGTTVLAGALLRRLSTGFDRNAGYVMEARRRLASGKETLEDAEDDAASA